MNEEWRPVVGYEGFYEVSNKGKVKSVKRYVNKISMHGTMCKKFVQVKILKPFFDNSGYKRVCLHKNGNNKQISVHSLVCGAFIGVKPENYDCCHRDGNKLNNCIENLRYDTKSNNRQDMKLNNTYQCRVKNPNHKLTEKEVQEIYILLKNTSITYKQISEKYSVHKATIININKGINWHLDSIDYPIRQIMSKYNSKRNHPTIHAK